MNAFQELAGWSLVAAIIYWWLDWSVRLWRANEGRGKHGNGSTPKAGL